MVMLHALRDRLMTFYDPISAAILPIIAGLLRRAMRVQGAEEFDWHILGMAVHGYKLAARHVQASGVPKPPLLLIHGLGDDSSTWGLILRSLAHDRDVYAIDMPGYGFSNLPPGRTHLSIAETADFLATFIRTIIQTPVVIAGNSMGGWLALWVAQQHPELLQALVLINSGGALLEGRTSWDPFIAVVGVPDLRTTRLATRQVFGRIPPIMLYAGSRGFQHMFQRSVVRAFVSTSTEQDFLSIEELQQIQTPTLVIWGLQDQFLPTGSLEFFAANLPAAQVVPLDHCGHLPQRERPRALVRAMKHFFSGLQPFATSQLSVAVLQ